MAKGATSGRTPMLDSLDLLKPHLFEPRGIEGNAAKKQWRKDNMAVTGPCALIYLLPVVWMIILGRYWLIGNVVTSAIGIWRSPGLARKVCGVVGFVALAVGAWLRQRLGG